MLSILGLLCCAPPRQAIDRRTSLLEGLVVGLIAGLLALGKLNFLLAGAFVVAAGAVLRPRSLASWIATVFAAACCVGAFAIYLHGDVAAWVGDVAMLIGVQKSGKRFRVIYNIITTPQTTVDLAMIGMIAALHLRRAAAPVQSKPVFGAYVTAVLGAAVLAGIGVFATSGNMQWYAIPLVAVAALFLAEAARSFAVPASTAAPDQLSSADGPESYRVRVTLSCLFAAIIALGIAVPDFLSVGYTFAWKRWMGPRMPADARIAARPLEDFLLPPRTYDPAKLDEIRAKLPTEEELRADTYQMGRRLNDGLALLKGRVDQDSRIFALEASNPFPFALQLPPPRARRACGT